nr:PREDICTED: uncharacterized protein LOC107078710 isoform X2 [Lepisosteus oculatus]
MSFLFCCCSCPAQAENPAERQPLLQPQSARQFRPERHGEKCGRCVVKLVGVPELDRSFVDIADTFNRQQEGHQAMTQSVRQLKSSAGGGPGSSLSDCLEQMKKEHGACNISIQMKGYDFSLVVQPDATSAKLLEAQEQVRRASQGSKSVAAAGTKLQEMISSVLQGEALLSRRVKEASQTYQEQVRVEANLRDNLLEVRRARELSAQYRKEAGALLNEVAQLAGITP